MRGISPVVATILMVVIAITAAVVAYSWFTSVQGSLQAKASQRLSSVSSITFTIPAVKCSETSVEVVIANLSDEPIDANASAALLDADGSVIDMATDVPVVVSAHDVNTITVNFSQSCDTAKSVMLTIGSASVVAPFK